MVSYVDVTIGKKAKTRAATQGVFDYTILHLIDKVCDTLQKYTIYFGKAELPKTYLELIREKERNKISENAIARQYAHELRKIQEGYRFAELDRKTRAKIEINHYRKQQYAD